MTLRIIHFTAASRSSNSRRKLLGVAVDAERQLREVIAADREAVEALRRTPSARITFDGISHIT